MMMLPSVRLLVLALVTLAVLVVLPAAPVRTTGALIMLTDPATPPLVMVGLALGVTGSLSVLVAPPVLSSVIANAVDPLPTSVVTADPVPPSWRLPRVMA